MIDGIRAFCPQWVKVGVDNGSKWFELVEGDFPPILGLLSFSVHLGLVKRIDALNT